MLEQVRTTIKKYNMLAPGDKVLTGVSGGPDSVALVHILSQIAPEFEVEIFIAHLNHCFRGQNSLDDAEFVRGLALKLGLKAVIESRDVSQYITEQKLSKQEGARKFRYKFFEEAGERLGCTKIATGHNANDQAETIINNFLRGSGSAGLGGIPPVRDGKVIRPLIEVSRTAIENYCSKNKLFPRTDESNLKKIYTRNRIRLELIPYLEKEYNSNLVETLVRTGEIFRDEEKYLQAETGRIWSDVVEKENFGEITFVTNRFLTAPEAIQKRLLRHAWSVLTGSPHNFGYLHIQKAIDLIRCARTGANINLPLGVLLTKSYECFTIALRNNQLMNQRLYSNYSYQLRIPGTTSIHETGDEIAVNIEGNNLKPNYESGTNEILIDMDLVSFPLTVRNRTPGDWFKPKGFEGTKKLKKFLIDSKIPRNYRDLLPIVVSGEGDVIWVSGLRADRRWLAGPETKRVLRLKLIRNLQKQN